MKKSINFSDANLPRFRLYFAHFLLRTEALNLSTATSILNTSALLLFIFYSSPAVIFTLSVASFDIAFYFFWFFIVGDLSLSIPGAMMLGPPNLFIT